jgi:AraC-like DNA-binding protein
MKPILERVPKRLNESFYCEIVSPSTAPTPWHFHPECQLSLIINARGHRVTGDNVANFGPGDLVFIGPNLPHVWHYEATADLTSEAIHAIVVQFSPASFGGTFLELPEMWRIRRLLRRGSVALRVDGKAGIQSAELMKLIPKAKGLRRVTLLLEILELVACSRDLRSLSSAGFDPQLNPLDEERVGKVCEFINQRLGEELARLVNLSPDAFGRFFRSRMGKPLPVFVNELRVSRACRMLADTEHSVMNIALDCGFENLANFNRQFLRHTQKTPRQYRATVRAAH